MMPEICKKVVARHASLTTFSREGVAACRQLAEPGQPARRGSIAPRARLQRSAGPESWNLSARRESEVKK
jgi:hypothetical protein